jgi:hypothetical protein
MSEELELLREEIAALERNVEVLGRRRTRNRLLEYTHLILAMKENLIKLKRKLKRLPETTEEDEEEKADTIELIDTMLYAIRQRERIVEDTEMEVLIEDMNSLRSGFSELAGSLEIDKLMFAVDFSGLPYEIKEEIKLDFEEIRRCYVAEAFRSAIGMCGRILHLALARKYFEKKGVDAIEQKWKTGQLIRKCFEDNVVDEPSLGDIFNLINRSRIDSVHTTRRLYRPQQDDTRPIIEFTIGLIKKLFPQNAVADKA